MLKEASLQRAQKTSSHHTIAKAVISTGQANPNVNTTYKTTTEAIYVIEIHPLGNAGTIIALD
jgi:pyruvate/2-oxoglutarate dehydrogenase complex dihydrolipoamide acyltransferase (E2) component